MSARTRPLVPASQPLVARRAVLLGMLGLAGGSLVACTGEDRRVASPPPRATTSTAAALTPTVSPAPVECDPLDDAQAGRTPLWETAMHRGIVYGSSAATWQIADEEYRRLFGREAAIMFTEDDLLWYRLRPSPDAE